MADEKSVDTLSIWPSLSVPSDEWFLRMLNIFCERVARYIGNSESEATEQTASITPTVGRRRNREIPLKVLWSAESCTLSKAPSEEL